MSSSKAILLGLSMIAVVLFITRSPSVATASTNTGAFAVSAPDAKGDVWVINTLYGVTAKCYAKGLSAPQCSEWSK